MLYLKRKKERERFRTIILKSLQLKLLKRRNALKILNIAKYGVLTCEICYRPIKKKKKWRATIDHIIPKSKGGSGKFKNLRIAHALCNNKKGDKIEKKKKKFKRHKKSK